MLAFQPRLPHALAPARSRRVRRPFHPPTGEGGYKLPRDVLERLTASLAPYRNREAAFALATFLGRFWSVPGRVAGSFPIDRRALAGHAGHDLTEVRVRGAIKALEEVGFLDRAIPAAGSRYKPTEDGLRRKPILFVFGTDYAPAFIAANGRATAARGGLSGARRPVTPENGPRASTGLKSQFFTNSPKSRIDPERSVLMGEVRKKIGIPPQAFVPDPKLEAALERLKGAIGKGG